MGYMLPLRFIKVSNKRSDTKQFDVAICATRIVAIMSTDIHQARRTITAEKKSGTLINACGSAAAKSAIFLDNGSVVASPLSVRSILTAVEKANIKAGSSKLRRLKVYEIADEDPKPEIDNDIDEMSAWDPNVDGKFDEDGD